MNIDVQSFIRAKTANPIRRILVFDVETTGLIPKPTYETEILNPSNPSNQLLIAKTKLKVPPPIEAYPYILQLSYIIYNLGQRSIEETYNAYINVDESIDISEKITEITGITRQICRERGINLTDALSKFAEAYAKCDYVVAHNMDFDSAAINAEMLRRGIEQTMFLPADSKKLYCTMKNSIHICNIMVDRARPIVESQTKASLVQAPISQYKKFPKLSELYQHLFGIVPENLHNSLIDTLVCLRCLLKIRFHMEIPDVRFAHLLSDSLKIS
jgi:DNA polymerase-3 subunit epsilon